MHARRALARFARPGRCDYDPRGAGRKRTRAMVIVPAHLLKPSFCATCMHPMHPPATRPSWGLAAFLFVSVVPSLPLPRALSDPHRGSFTRRAVPVCHFYVSPDRRSSLPSSHCRQVAPAPGPARKASVPGSLCILRVCAAGLPRCIVRGCLLFALFSPNPSRSSLSVTQSYAVLVDRGTMCRFALLRFRWRAWRCHTCHHLTSKRG